MRLQPRILAFVGGLFIVLASAVNLVHQRPQGMAAAITERVSPGLPPVADVQMQAMQISVKRYALSVILPSCDVRSFQDRFFVHVYDEAPAPGHPVAYVNRDFDIATAPLRHLGASTGGAEHCAVDRMFGTAAAEVVFGQFQMIDGKCCTIVWSRDIRFEDQ